MTQRAQALLLVGASGDLAQRMLLPSLFGLATEGLLPKTLRIIATGRDDFNDGQFRDVVANALQRYIEPHRRHEAQAKAFLSRLSYQRLDVGSPADFKNVAEAVGDVRGGLAVFLSIAPSLFPSAIAGLKAAGLAGPMARLALEKPLGTDLLSSCEINDAVGQVYSEDRTFRIDHYLGKETVQNLIALRFANALLEPRWSTDAIKHVQITVAETVGLEARAGYYDGAGALRDMVQNHMLQLLALVAMEPPARFDAPSVRDEKVKVLRSLRPIDRRTVGTHSVIGQYGAGAMTGNAVPSYAHELGGPSTTETFVALKVHIDNWRWKAVPFYLRTGKRMPCRRSEILIEFKDLPHSIFTGPAATLQPNKLLIRLQPDENIRLLLMAKTPGLDRSGIELREVPLDVAIPNAFADGRRRIAYERLLLDLIEGNQTLFVRRDEIEAQWRWTDAIRDGWAANSMIPKLYPAGCWGPAGAIALAERDGVSWHE